MYVSFSHFLIRIQHRMRVWQLECTVKSRTDAMYTQKLVFTVTTDPYRDDHARVCLRDAFQRSNIVCDESVMNTLKTKPDLYFLAEHRGRHGSVSIEEYDDIQKVFKHGLLTPLPGNVVCMIQY